jgi:hypothetical protein
MEQSRKRYSQEKIDRMNQILCDIGSLQREVNIEKRVGEYERIINEMEKEDGGYFAGPIKELKSHITTLITIRISNVLREYKNRPKGIETYNLCDSLIRMMERHGGFKDFLTRFYNLRNEIAASAKKEIDRDIRGMIEQGDLEEIAAPSNSAAAG